MLREQAAAAMYKWVASCRLDQVEYALIVRVEGHSASMS